MDTAEIKQQVPIETVVGYYGGAVNANGKRQTCLRASNHNHGDADPSMTIRDGRVKCWSQGCFGERGADVFGLVGIMEGLTRFGDQKRRVMEIGGLTGLDRIPRRIIRQFKYVDAQGRVAYKNRWSSGKPKFSFSQDADGLIRGLGDCSPTLYGRGPDGEESAPMDTVIMTAGEHDADVVNTWLESLGRQTTVATCTPHGETNVKREYLQPLLDDRIPTVYLSGDNDKAGQGYVSKCGALLQRKVPTLRILKVPEEFKDWAEWAEAGGTAEQFSALLEQAAPWTPLGEALVSEPGGIVLISAADIRPEPVKWAWKGKVPLGGLTVFGGMPGEGKSTIALDLAARLSCGTLPGALFDHPVPVVIASAEDSARHTMVPRLIAAGADLKNVKFVQNRREGIECGITLPDDIPTIKCVMAESGSRMLIIDPLMAHLAGKVNSWRDQDIRRALAPLARLADELEATVIVVVHLTKTQARAVLERIGGSIAIVAAARSVLIAAQDPTQPEPEPGTPIPRVFVHVKCNQELFAPTLRYQIQTVFVGDENEGRIKTSAIVWGQEAPDIQADDLVQDPFSKEERRERAEAREWLRESLSEGPRPQQEVIREAKQVGISEATLRRARGDLGVKPDKVGFGKNGYWEWALPKDAHPPIKDAQSSEAEHLKRNLGQKRASDAGLVKDAHIPDIEHLSGADEHLHQAEAPPVHHPIGARIWFDGGLGFEETGIIEAVTEWSQYPQQVCYRVRTATGIRTIPRSRVLGVEENQ